MLNLKPIINVIPDTHCAPECRVPAILVSSINYPGWTGVRATELDSHKPDAYVLERMLSETTACSGLNLPSERIQLQTSLVYVQCRII